jgi:hypothetical protein
MTIKAEGADAMNEKDIKNEARIMAHEHVVCQLSLLLYRLLPPGSASVMHQGTKASAQRLTFPGLDPALSDLFSARARARLRPIGGNAKSFIGIGAVATDKTKLVS